VSLPSWINCLIHHRHCHHLSVCCLVVVVVVVVVSGLVWVVFSVVAREVCGFAPYERKIQELLKNEKDKRALRFAKKRLGTLGRAKRKREEMAGFLRKKKGGKK